MLGLLGEQQLIGQKQIDDLNQHINEKTQNLTGLLNESNIGINVTFGLPTLLRDFWQQLSVGTNYEYIEKITQQISKKKGAEVDLNPKSYQIPLTMRGDGVKSKFLPPILKWLQNNNRSMILFGESTNRKIPLSSVQPRLSVRYFVMNMQRPRKSLRLRILWLS